MRRDGIGLWTASILNCFRFWVCNSWPCNVEESLPCKFVRPSTRCCKSLPPQFYNLLIARLISIIFVVMMADFVTLKSQVLVPNDSGESLTDGAAGTTATRGNGGGSMSADDWEVGISGIDNEHGGLEISWGSALDKGRRTAMEDAIAIVPVFISPVGWKVGGSPTSTATVDLNWPEEKVEEEDSPVHYFGLFDGHGGSQVSTYCSKKFHELLAEEWIRGGSDNGQNGRWEMALTKSYERVDNAFKDKTLAPYSVGSTALVVLLSACQIIVANCGDSRALLCRGSQAIPLTADHKISRPDEYDRLVKGGARILFVGCPRVEGVLSMTRSIGDHYLKPWIIPEPEVTFMSRTDEDECLILASDGVWDVLSNNDVMKMACGILRRQRRKLGLGGIHDAIYPAQYVANQILKVASHLSGDNMSVIVVDLKHRMHRMKEL